ncbi:MAG TPA: hypothetical protein VM618_11245 [Acidimicrobiia bacterium]|nr:hypothetical protein [Acidimicrobiia bacterium]
MRRWTALAVGVCAVASGIGGRAAGAGPAPGIATTGGTTIVLSPEDNRLNAYDAADPSVKQTIIEGVHVYSSPNGGVGVTDETLRRDINGQVCIDPENPRRFVAGEDTDQDPSANPPVLPGWGYFELDGSKVGNLSVTQLGKLTPASYLGSPDNQGCGFLSSDEIVTTTIGDVFPHEPATGELVLFFGPFDRTDVPSCKLDTTLGTAGGLWVDPDARAIYVATNRPGADGLPGGVYRYTGDFPTAATPAGGCGRIDASGAPLVDAGRITKELFIAGAPFSMTPSTVIGSGRGTFYVSSVFTGTVAEYDGDGLFLRYVLVPPMPPPGGAFTATGVTPFGLATTPDGSLWVADLGIQPNANDGLGAVHEEGSVVRIEFGTLGLPRPFAVVDESLTFPDGLGVTTLPPPAR